jgi:hypothetical protein
MANYHLHLNDRFTVVNQTFTVIFRLTLHLLKDDADHQLYLI